VKIREIRGFLTYLASQSVR